MGGARGCRDRTAVARRYQSQSHSNSHSRRGRTHAAGTQPQTGAGGRGSRVALYHSPVRRAAAACVRRACQALEQMITLLVLLTLQSDGWTAAPPQPTVGDTIRLERAITAPAGWRLRA